MSNYTISLDNKQSAIPYTIFPRITLGDTLTITKGSGYTGDTHYRCIINFANTRLILPSDDSYSTSSTFSYTFSTSLLNTDLLEAWGTGCIVSYHAYRQVSYTLKGETIVGYLDAGESACQGVIQVDTTQYHPILSLGDIHCVDSKNYKGLLLAGISKFGCSVTIGHNKSDDKATLYDPIGTLHLTDVSGFRGVLDYNASSKSFTSTNEVPTSNENYKISIWGYIKDGRFVYQDGTKESLSGTLLEGSTTPHGYIKTSDVTVYSYAYPTYNPTYTYVNRCTASGRADGMGAYARIHIHYAISKVDGDNVLNDIILRVNSSDCTQYRINSNWKTGEYADYIVPLVVGESGNIEITMTDSVCVALGTTSVITSLSVPKATLPLSLFDNGTDRGTAFGQMATRPGNWFYNNLVVVKNNEPYLLDIHKNTLVSRPLCGDTGSSTVKVTYTCTGSLFDEYYFVICEYDLASIVIENKIDGGQFDIPIGTLLLVYLGTTAMSGGVHDLYVNGTKISDSDHIYTYTTAGVPVYYFSPTENTDIVMFYHKSSYTPTVTDKRPTLTVSTSTASYYSFSDEDAVHTSDNADLELRGVTGYTCTFKISQKCTDKLFKHWLYQGQTYTEDYVKNTGIVPPNNTNTNLVAVYEDLPAPQITITVIGHNNGWATISVNGTSVYDKEPPTGTVTISANQNSSLSIYYFDSNRINDIRINGTSHKSMTMEQTLEYTASDDTTIEFY